MKFQAKHKVTLEFIDEIEATDLSEATQFYDKNPLLLRAKCFVGATVSGHELLGVLEKEQD